MRTSNVARSADLVLAGYDFSGVDGRAAWRR